MVTEIKSAWVDHGSGPVRNPELSEQEFAAALVAVKEANIAALWQAAHDYEYAEISGSAIGALVLGVMQSKPKCSAVQAWIQSIWNLYYTRKPLVTHEASSVSFDFSSCGPIPYTVPELMSEIGM